MREQDSSLRIVEYQKPDSFEWVKVHLHQLDPGDVFRFTDQPDKVWVATSFGQPARVEGDCVEPKTELDGCILGLYRIRHTKNVRAALELLRKGRKTASYYLVQKGDTLSQLAEAFFGDKNRYTQIANDNKITNPDLIHTGQWLKIASYSDK